MKWVFFTALTVGAATMLGAGLGFLFKRVNETVRRCLIGAAGGIMLHATVFGLIEPSTQLAQKGATLLTVLGLFLGFGFLSLIRMLSPRILSRYGQEKKASSLLFLFAMGIHHIPEGIAAGVSFGTGEASDVIRVAGGIALQNIPEGMVLIPPLLALGISAVHATIISLGIAFLEAAGVYFGFFSISISITILPIALGFAAGTMIYVMLGDMFPDATPCSYSQKPIYSSLIGFSMMMVLGLFL